MMSVGTYSVEWSSLGGAVKAETRWECNTAEAEGWVLEPTIKVTKQKWVVWVSWSREKCAWRSWWRKVRRERISMAEEMSVRGVGWRRGVDSFRGSERVAGMSMNWSSREVKGVAGGGRVWAVIYHNPNRYAWWRGQWRLQRCLLD